MAAFLIALLVAGGTVVVYFSIVGIESSVSKSSTSTAVGSSSGVLIITSVSGDVVSINHPEALSSNSSSVVGRTPFVGAPGETFTLRFDIVYQACACGPRVVEVDSLTPGFTVVGTTPSLPVGFQGAGGDFYQASFTVEVKAPATSYTGSVTLLAHIG